MGASLRARLERLDDGDLVARCAAGEAVAWEVLVHRYRRLVYAVPSRAGLASDEADDVFQDTFTRLLAALPTLRDRSRVRAWLVTTARRLTVDVTRRRRGIEDAEAVLERTADAAPEIDEVIAALEEQHRVRAALGRLDERCRRLLELLYGSHTASEPVSYRDIARRLDMPVGSIGPTRARCLAKLLRQYERDEAVEGESRP
ncbi:MAG: sigma-70 family RNA polymerase sigma factor [Candidatus Eiseniibacteriota bacterium]